MVTYCVRCKKEVELVNPVEEKTGDYIRFKGKCPDCQKPLYYFPKQSPIHSQGGIIK